MSDASLRGDCSRCIGLCCVILAFDRGPLFGFDKPPGRACRHLDGCDRCSIHEALDVRGFAGCAAYDCFGAGQVVTAMFEGRHWSDGERTLRAMYDAFILVREANSRVLAAKLGAER